MDQHPIPMPIFTRFLARRDKHQKARNLMLTPSPVTRLGRDQYARISKSRESLLRVTWEKNYPPFISRKIPKNSLKLEIAIYPWRSAVSQLLNFYIFFKCSRNSLFSLHNIVFFGVFLKILSFNFDNGKSAFTLFSELLCWHPYVTFFAHIWALAFLVTFWLKLRIHYDYHNFVNKQSTKNNVTIFEITIWK